MTQHTPGPWKWQKGERYWRLWAGNDTKPGETVSILRADCKVGNRIQAPSLVNIRLFAAAPEMLEVVRLFADVTETSKPLKQMERARALLARIEGR